MAEQTARERRCMVTVQWFRGSQMYAYRCVPPNRDGADGVIGFRTPAAAVEDAQAEFGTLYQCRHHPETWTTDPAYALAWK